MLNVETIRKVCQAHFRDGKRIREISRDLNLSRNTVTAQPHPKLGTFIERLSELLQQDSINRSVTTGVLSSCLSNCSEKETNLFLSWGVVPYHNVERALTLVVQDQVFVNRPSSTAERACTV